MTTEPRKALRSILAMHAAAHPFTSRHTPGPWKFDDLAPNVAIYSLEIAAADREGKTVCVVGDNYTDHSNDDEAAEFKADVLLITAAPDLLAALEKFVGYAQNGKHPAYARYLKTAAGTEMLDSIAKAKGLS